jgi:hypothetical protein
MAPHSYFSLFISVLVPIKESTPQVAFGTQYTGQVNFTSPGEGNEIRLLVGFDVPPNLGTRSAIKFGLGPKPPGGYQWTVDGTGKLSVWSLKSIINLSMLRLYTVHMTPESER